MFFFATIMLYQKLIQDSITNLKAPIYCIYNIYNVYYYYYFFFYRNQLELLQTREIKRDNSNNILKTRLKNLQSSFKETKENNCILKLTLNDQRMKINELSNQLASLNVYLTLIEFKSP